MKSENKIFYMALSLIILWGLLKTGTTWQYEKVSARINSDRMDYALEMGRAFGCAEKKGEHNAE